MNFQKLNIFSVLKRTVIFLSSRQMLFIAFLVLLSIFVNFTFIFRPLRGKHWLSKIYKMPLKQTLQKVDGPLIENGMDVRVLKVKKGNKIHLEFLSKQADDSFFIINSVELKGSREAYYRYWEKEREIYSLLLFDDDGDGRLDVIAPTFDRFFLPQNNVVVYSQQTKQFELKPGSSYSQITHPSSWPTPSFYHNRLN